MAVGTVPAGWYPDSQDAALLRWWDGTQWTAHIQPRPVQVPVPGRPNAAAAATGAARAGLGRHERHPGSRRALQAEVDRLRQALDGMGVTEREQLAAEVTRLRDEAGRAGRAGPQLVETRETVMLAGGRDLPVPASAR